MANISLSPNGSRVVISDGDYFMGTTSGVEEIIIQSGVTGTAVDANVEKIHLPSSLHGYKFYVVAGTGFRVYDKVGNIVLTVSSLNQTATLFFTNGSTNLAKTGTDAFTLGGQAVATTGGPTAIHLSALPSLFDTTLTSKSDGATGGPIVVDTTIALPGENKQVFVCSNTKVIGHIGTENVYIVPGSTGVFTDGAIERVIFVGNIADYAFGQDGARVFVHKGGALIATCACPDLIKLVFNDGTVDTDVVSGVVRFGGLAITGTATSPVAIVPTIVATSNTTSD